MHDLTTAPHPASAPRLPSAPPDLTPSLRYRGGQEHHLWQKRGIWFVRYSVISSGAGKAHRRVCRSLGTRDRLIARRRRDEILANTVGHAGSPPLPPSEPK
jgi:hypothetical protein